MINKQGYFIIFISIVSILIQSKMHAKDLPKVRVKTVKRIFDNGEHNAFTDLIRFKGKFYLAFRSCPDGHMVHPTAEINKIKEIDYEKFYCKFADFFIVIYNDAIRCCK
ncbi:hypothetical protein H8E88_22155 [candidate division KSB1 bacterium]|nr:hypothetical protein [candidate division KSB1 bacterium]MBL7093840.1 hypothetical protein [candidate division KSB1 bacterium]